MDLAARYLQLDHLIDEKESEVKELKAKKGEMERELLRLFEKSGVQSVKTAAGTCYLHCTMVARPKEGIDRRQVADTLKTVGLEDYVSEEPTYNTQSLDAYVREQARNSEDIPAALADLLKITELYFVRCRK